MLKDLFYSGNSHQRRLMRRACQRALGEQLQAYRFNQSLRRIRRPWTASSRRRIRARQLIRDLLDRQEKRNVAMPEPVEKAIDHQPVAPAPIGPKRSHRRPSSVWRLVAAGMAFFISFGRNLSLMLR